MNERFERLATLPGKNPASGLPASAWEANLGDVDRDQLLRAVIAVIRKLVLPEWETSRADDRRPQLALEATEAWLASKTPDAAAQAKATAKDCTAARQETFGRDHRVPEAARAIAWACCPWHRLPRQWLVPEAARAIAWAVGAKDNKPIWDALTVVEEELLARIAMVSDYHLQPKQRRAIVDTLREVLAPAPKATVPASSEPAAYSPKGEFTVGQRLTHPKFGNLLVSAVGDKWIEVDLDDGTRKKLAQKSG